MNHAYPGMQCGLRTCVTLINLNQECDISQLEVSQLGYTVPCIYLSSYNSTKSGKAKALPATPLPLPLSGKAHST